jgi:hypothetical protein
MESLVSTWRVKEALRVTAATSATVTVNEKVPAELGVPARPKEAPLLLTDVPGGGPGATDQL